MMIHLQKTRRHMLAPLMLVVFLIQSSMITGKKNDNTDAPTRRPSPSPTTAAPTMLPTNNPTTQSPTRSPTVVPTSGPTLSPVVAPALSPTLQQSFSPSIVLETSSSPTARQITLSPTDHMAAATLAPTTKATFPPTEVDTSTDDTITTTNAVVALPTLGIDLILSDADARSPVAENIDSALQLFLDDAIAANSDAIHTLDYVEFEFEFLFSVFGRRRLTTGMSVRVDGKAFYGSEAAPTEAELSRSLGLYFAVEGIPALEKYLAQESGLPSVYVASVSVDGDVVRRQPTGHDNENGENSPPPQAGATVQSPDKSVVDSGSSNKRDFTPGMVIGLVGAVLVVIVLAALAGSRNRQQHEVVRQGPDALKSGQDDLEGGTAGAPKGSPTKTARDDDDANSVDLSVYTTNTVAVSGRPKPRPPLVSSPPQSKQTKKSSSPPKPYDAARLDQVIQLAKQRSGEL